MPGLGLVCLLRACGSPVGALRRGSGPGAGISCHLTLSLGPPLELGPQALKLKGNWPGRLCLEPLGSGQRGDGDCHQGLLSAWRGPSLTVTAAPRCPDTGFLISILAPARRCQLLHSPFTGEALRSGEWNLFPGRLRRSCGQLWTRLIQAWSPITELCALEAPTRGGGLSPASRLPAPALGLDSGIRGGVHTHPWFGRHVWH